MCQLNVNPGEPPEGGESTATAEVATPRDTYQYPTRTLLLAARQRAVIDVGYAPTYVKRRGLRLWDEGGRERFRFRPCRDRRFVWVHRDGGGEYATDGVSCQCKGSSHPDCRHRRALREVGGVPSVYAAFREYRRVYAALRAAAEA